MRLSRVLFPLCAFFLLCSNATIADELKLATSPWSPYVDENMPGKGLAIKIVTTALARAGYSTELKIESWTRTLEGTDIGVYDVIPTAWYSEKRAQSFAFSKPYLTNKIMFLKRKDDAFTFNSLSDLNSRIIGIIPNYAYGHEFDESGNFFRVNSKHLVENLTKLQLGQINLTLDDERVLLHDLNKYMSNSRDEFEILLKPISVNGLHIAVSKKRPDNGKIVAAFDKAIEEMKRDGEFEKILNEYNIRRKTL
jgi:polar amino acid transport system substrate-binding protein